MLGIVMRHPIFSEQRVISDAIQRHWFAAGCAAAPMLKAVQCGKGGLVRIDQGELCGSGRWAGSGRMTVAGEFDDNRVGRIDEPRYELEPLVPKRSSKLQAKSLPQVTPFLPTADYSTAGLKYRLGSGEAAVQRAYRSAAR